MSVIVPEVTQANGALRDPDFLPQGRLSFSVSRRAVLLKNPGLSANGFVLKLVFPKKNFSFHCLQKFPLLPVTAADICFRKIVNGPCLCGIQTDI